MKAILDEIKQELEGLRNQKKGLFNFGPLRTRRYKKIRIMEQHLETAYISLKEYMKHSRYLH